MVKTSPAHWVGVVFLLIASILLLVTTITAPVIRDIAILKVMLRNETHIRHGSIIFGTFGHCALDIPPLDTDQDYCAPKVIGYQAASIMNSADGTEFSQSAADSVNGLTKTMILHPIAAGVAFIAFLVSCGAGVVGSLLGSMIAALAWILALVAMAIDFALFGVIKNHVNANAAKSGSNAYYSTGMWTILAAVILLFFGMLIVLFTCFSSRKEKKRTSYSYADKNSHNGYVDAGMGNAAVPRRKRFGIL